MTDLVEMVAFALWREDAVRAAPNTARYRTLFTFQGESETLKDKWRGLARAALRAVADALDEVKGEPATLTVQTIGQPDQEIILDHRASVPEGEGFCRKCGADREGWLKCSHSICPGGDVFGQRYEPPPALRACGKCRKCGGDMVEGMALEQTFTAGTPDFPGDKEAVTFSAGGPGKMVPCHKCILCGWSVSA